MGHVLVTLVSEQAIPNVQYIKEFQPSEAYLFISTAKMEEKNKTQNIVAACSLDTAVVQTVVVNEEDFSDIQSKLSQALQTPLFSKADEIIVNCTLGTKVMSIALFDYFKDNSKAKIYYTPINTNKYKSINTNEERPFSQIITIEEYLKGYGIGIKKKSRPLYSFETSERIFNAFIHFKSDDFEVLNEMRERKEKDEKGIERRVIGRDKGVKSIQAIKNLDNFLDTIGFIPSEVGKLNKREVVYLTGGWFEEWTYFKIQMALGLASDQIALGLESVIEADNDLDIVFIWRNDLYIIECKTTLSKELRQTTLYKSGALLDKFGRNAKSYLYTLSDLRENGKLMESVDLRARQQNVIVYDKQDLLHNFDKFITALKR